MSSLVALKLLLEGGRETAAGINSVGKSTSELGVIANKSSVGLKKMATGLTSLEKQGLSTAGALDKASTKVVLAEKKVSDALRASALAAKQAGDAKVRAANLAADAVAKAAAGDLEAAKASRTAAKAATEQATAYTKMATAMRAQAGAARANLASVKAVSRGGAGGGSSNGLYGLLARGGGLGVKAGLGTAAFLGYQGIKRGAGVESQALQLHTLANVPMQDIPALQRFAIQQSPGLRAPSSQLLQEAYRIASSSPGKPYSAGTIKKLTAASQRFTLLGGPTVDPDQAARIFGIVRANGGLGVKGSYDKIGAISRSIIGSGDMTAGDLVAAIGTGGLAVNAARHHISYTQLGGALAEEGDLGVNGSRAGNALAHAISLLASPNGKQASGIYESIGLNPTAIDQVIRSKGLMAGIGLLRRQLVARAPEAMPGMTGTVNDFLGLGYNRKQAKQFAGQGASSLQDLLLTRMFGGAKQSIPIIALLSGLDRTKGKTAEIAKGANLANYRKDVSLTANNPQNTFKRFDLDVQQLETNIGLKLIPELMSAANWISRNEDEVKDIAKAVEILAIPAFGAWAATLVGKGVGGLQKFGTGMATAEGRVGTLQRGVLGLTTAIGVYELGSHTSGGAMGAGEATLSGALAGMTAGLAVGGPWGAAVGAAAGGLIGLAGHFHLLTGDVNANNKAMQGWMQTAYQADNFKVGQQFRSQLNQYLSGQSQTTLDALTAGGVTTKQIVSGLKGGGSGTGPAYSRLFSSLANGKITEGQYDTALKALNAIDSAFYSKVQVLNDVAKLEGKSTQAERTSISNLQSILGLNATAVDGVKGDLSSLYTGALPHAHHVHVHIDGKEVATTVNKHNGDTLAGLLAP